MGYLSNQRFLTVYSGILTAVFAVTILGGFASHNKKSAFGEIDVQRINIVEPDGTLRMVLSDKSRVPGMIIKGKEYPNDERKTAGILFFDDEGTEDGGLVFGGRRDKNGKVESWGHLSFDQYDQDQVLSMDAGEDESGRRSGIGIWDRGNYPISEALEASLRIRKLPPEQRDIEWNKFAAAHPGDTPRAYLGRVDDQSVGLRLMDKNGHDRLRLRINPDGSPVIEFLNASGNVTEQFPAGAGAR